MEHIYNLLGDKMENANKLHPKQISVKLPHQYILFLDVLVRKGYANNQTDAVKYCVQHVMDKSNGGNSL
jgi:hypothetical protein